MAYEDFEAALAVRLNCSVDDVWLYDVPEDIYRDAMNATELIEELSALGISLEEAECFKHSWNPDALDWGPTCYRRD